MLAEPLRKWDGYVRKYEGPRWCDIFTEVDEVRTAGTPYGSGKAKKKGGATKIDLEEPTKSVKRREAKEGSQSPKKTTERGEKKSLHHDELRQEGVMPDRDRRRKRR